MLDGSGPDKKGKSGKGKNKAEVPHKIPYTVAGMPRGGVGGGDGDRSVPDRRGPREGILTASTSWSLLDLKVLHGEQRFDWAVHQV